MLQVNTFELLFEHKIANQYFMRVAFIFVFSFLLGVSLIGQTFFTGDIHQVDIDIMEMNNSSFQDFTKEEVEVLWIFHRALVKFDLQEKYKMVGVFIEGKSQGVYVVIDKKHYQILPATVETYSDLSSKRFLLMRHHEFRQPQLILYEETLKNGVAFDFFQDHFRVYNYRNSLPVGQQTEYDLTSDNIITTEARIVPLTDKSQLIYADTVEVLNREINTYEGFIVERSDSTSVIQQ